MKKIVVAMLVLAGMATAQEANKDVKELEIRKVDAMKMMAHKKMAKAAFKVEGWKTPADSTKTMDALKKIDGVLKVRVNLDAQMCSVAYDQTKIKAEDLAKTIEGSGFKSIAMKHAKPMKMKMPVDAELEPKKEAAPKK